MAINKFDVSVRLVQRLNHDFSIVPRPRDYCSVVRRRLIVIAVPIIFSRFRGRLISSQS